MKYSEASKDEVRDWMTETLWLLAEDAGANRECGSCQKSMLYADRRRLDGSGCLRHGFRTPLVTDYEKAKR